MTSGRRPPPSPASPRPAAALVEESPYAGLADTEWPKVTKRLITAHPLTREFKDVVLTAWTDIFRTRIGGKRYRIGKDINPSPQIMGCFLHELVPLVFQDKYPGKWRRQQDKRDKDLVCLFDAAFSVEIKTSSHRSQIFGNRSYGQPSTNPSDHRRKGKSGYYLAVNFEKFAANATPRIVQVRFGWLDHTDWIAQRAATGQQARVDPRADAKKLIRLYALGSVGDDSSEP